MSKPEYSPPSYVDALTPLEKVKLARKDYINKEKKQIDDEFDENVTRLSKNIGGGKVAIDVCFTIYEGDDRPAKEEIIKYTMYKYGKAGFRCRRTDVTSRYGDYIDVTLKISLKESEECVVL